jgi:hypothetical protein
MKGSTIFLMYADGNGNVTASVRDGGSQGHVEPTLSSKQTGLTLLAGSGIVGGNMVANLLCMQFNPVTKRGLTWDRHNMHTFIIRNSDQFTIYCSMGTR